MSLVWDAPEVQVGWVNKAITGREPRMESPGITITYNSDYCGDAFIDMPEFDSFEITYVTEPEGRYDHRGRLWPFGTKFMRIRIPAATLKAFSRDTVIAEVIEKLEGML